VPAERVTILHKAFDEMLKDAAFLDDAKRSGIDVSPVGGERVQKTVADFMNTPAEIVTKAKLAMEPKNITERAK
jgi:tripartite-type tricarboxylate transporter receptor subunit TctC